METKVSHDEEIDLLLQDLQSNSSPSSMMHVQHLLSSVVSPQRMKSNECSEWYHELCTQMEHESALRLMVFVVMKAHCHRGKSKKLMELANMKKEPYLNDFRDLDEFNDLALNKLTGDLAYQGVSVKVINHLARHKLHFHPNKYLPSGATDAKFEGCLLLLNDAVQSEVFTLDDLSRLREIFSEYKERKANKVLDDFEGELAQGAKHPQPSATQPVDVSPAASVTGTHPPVTTPNPEHPPTVVATPLAHSPAMQPPPTTVSYHQMHAPSLAHPPSASAPPYLGPSVQHPPFSSYFPQVPAQPHPMQSPDGFEQPSMQVAAPTQVYPTNHSAPVVLPLYTHGKGPFESQFSSSPPPSYSDVANQSRFSRSHLGTHYQENPNQEPVTRLPQSFPHITTLQQQQQQEQQQFHHQQQQQYHQQQQQQQQQQYQQQQQQHQQQQFHHHQQQQQQQQFQQQQQYQQQQQQHQQQQYQQQQQQKQLQLNQQQLQHCHQQTMEQQPQHMGASAPEPTHITSQHQGTLQVLTPRVPSVYPTQHRETSEPNSPATYPALIEFSSHKESSSSTGVHEDMSSSCNASARSEAILSHPPSSNPPDTTPAHVSSPECLGALEPMQSRVSSQSPHSSQSTHPMYVHQQGKEGSLAATAATLRDRSSSDSTIQRKQKAGTSPSPLTSGQSLSGTSSSDCSMRDRSISFSQDDLRGSGYSSLKSSKVLSQESEDGGRGSSKLVSSSEMLYPGSQTPRAPFLRQDLMEERPQLEKQSSVIDQVYSLLHKSYDALPYFQAAKGPLNKSNTVYPPLRRITGEHEDVGYTDFFQLFPSNLEEIHTVVVAESGYGKTTLMITAAKEWRKGTILTNIKTLLLVPMSKISGKTSIDLKDLLELYLDSKEKCECAAKALTEDAGKGLCILFDGLQEGPYLEVLDFIHGVKLQNASVYATCRPHLELRRQLEAPKVSFYSIEGLQYSHIQQYAEKYFSKEGEATKFLKYLEEHPNIEMMCSVPMHLSIIACLFDTNDKAALDSFTETDILQAFIVYIAQCSIGRSREMSSLSQLASHYHNVVPNLCKESLQMAKECTLMLPNHFPIEHALTVFNTVLVREKRGSTVNARHVYRFSHAVVRDFFAAFGLKSSCETGEEHMLPDGVLKFLCGLQAGQLKQDALSRIIRHNTDQDGYVSMLPFHCVYQTKVVRFCSYLVQELNHSVKFKAPETPLTVSDCFVLATVILKGVVYELEFGPRSLTVDSLKVFTASLEKSTRTLPSLQKLSICGPFGTGAGNLITCILHKCPALQHLSLSGIPLAQGVMGYIEEHNILRSMSLSRCSLDHEVANQLGQTLKQLQQLEELDLSYNPLGTEGLESLEDGLSSCHLITHLRLCGCSFSPDSGKALFQMLKKLKELKSLDLGDNKLGAEGIRELQNVAIELHNLRSVSFANNNLPNGDQLWSLVGFAVCCRSLEELRLNSNGLSQESEVVKLLYNNKPHLKVTV